MNDKFALITGSSSGIGRAYAFKFASLGYDLLLISRNLTKLNGVKEDIQKKYGVTIELIQRDLSDEKQIQNVEATIIPKYNILALINNAGFGTSGPFHEIPIDKSLSMVNVHIIATMRFTKAVLANMIQKNDGIIINVSSVGAFIKIPDNLIYSATKSFINTFSEHLHLELSDTNIIVQAICPGYTRTDFYKTDEFKRLDVSKVPNMLWMDADTLVDKSIKALSKKRFIFIPGFFAKLSFLCKKILSNLLIKIINKTKK